MDPKTSRRLTASGSLFSIRFDLGLDEELAARESSQVYTDPEAGKCSGVNNHGNWGGFS